MSKASEIIFRGNVVEQNEVEIKGKIMPNIPVAVNSHGIGVTMCALTLLGTRLGGGIVGIPISTQNIGYLTIAIFQSIYIWMGMFSMWMLLRTREITGRSSYSNLGMHLFGNWSIYFVNSCIALAQLGFPIIFFIVFGDAAKSIIDRIDRESHPFLSSRVFTHTVLAFLMLYLVIQKDMHRLKYASVLLFFGIVVFIIIMFAHYLTSDPDPESKKDLVYTSLSIKFFASVPTVISSYSFEPSLFSAFASLKHKTSKNGFLAGTTAIVVAFIVYLITPLLAFGLYGINIKPNLLLNIGEEDGALPIVLESMFLVIAVVHIPIIFFVGKEAVLIMFDEATRGSYSKKHPEILKAPDDIIEDEVVISEVLSQPKNQDDIPEGQEVDAENPVEVVNQEVVQNSEDFEAPEVGENPEDVRNPEDVSQLEESSTKIKTHEASNAHVHVIHNPKEYLNMKPHHYYIVTLIWFVIVVVLSIVVGNVNVFFGLIGASSGWWNVIAGPASFYVWAVHKYKIKLDTIWLKLSYYVAWSYIIIGYSAMVFLIICVILNTVS